MLAFKKTNQYQKNINFVNLFFSNIKKWFCFVTKNYYKNPKYRV